MRAQSPAALVTYRPIVLTKRAALCLDVPAEQDAAHLAEAMMANIADGRRCALRIAIVVADAHDRVFAGRYSAWVAWAASAGGYSPRVAIRLLHAGRVIVRTWWAQVSSLGMTDAQATQVYHGYSNSADLQALECLDRLDELALIQVLRRHGPELLTRGRNEMRALVNACLRAQGQQELADETAHQDDDALGVVSRRLARRVQAVRKDLADLLQAFPAARGSVDRDALRTLAAELLALAGEEEGTGDSGLGTGAEGEAEGEAEGKSEQREVNREETAADGGDAAGDGQPIRPSAEVAAHAPAAAASSPSAAVPAPLPPLDVASFMAGSAPVPSCQSPVPAEEA